jgi:hypothetical protein
MAGFKKGGIILGQKSSFPDVPNSGEVIAYANNDGSLHVINSSGVDVPIGAGGSGGSSNLFSAGVSGSVIGPTTVQISSADYWLNANGNWNTIPTFSISGSGLVPVPTSVQISAADYYFNATTGWSVIPNFTGDIIATDIDLITPNLVNNSTAGNIITTTGTRTTDGYEATNTSYTPDTPSTGWGGQNISNPDITWEIDFGQLTHIVSYSLMGHFHYGSDLSPTEWIFSGSNDQSTWIQLDHPTGVNTLETLYTGYISGGVPYRYYQYTFIAGVGGATSYNLIMSNYQMTGFFGSAETHSGLVPAPDVGDANLNKFLHAEGGWQEIPSISVFNVSGSGLVPQPSTTDDISGHFLRADQTWQPMAPEVLVVSFVAPNNGTYTILLSSPAKYLITNLVYEMDLGSCAVSINQNGTAITGLDSISPTNSTQVAVPSSTTYVVIGDKLTIGITSASGNSANLTCQLTMMISL